MFRFSFFDRILQFSFLLIGDLNLSPSVFLCYIYMSLLVLFASSSMAKRGNGCSMLRLTMPFFVLSE